MTKYRVCVHIDKVTGDRHQTIDTPLEIGCFSSKKDARTYIDQLTSPMGLHIDPPSAEMGSHPAFRVVYVIDLNAPTAEEAAHETHKIFLDPEAIAPVLYVIDSQGKQTTIDLSLN